MRASAWDRECRLVRQLNFGKHRTQFAPFAKRPLANFAWKTGHKPINSYHHQYYERLRKLNFDFLRNDEESIAIALRFVLSVPGVHTAIVGTTKPERCQENARRLESRPLPQNEYNIIRERWDVIAPKTWIGQP